MVRGVSSAGEGRLLLCRTSVTTTGVCSSSFSRRLGLTGGGGGVVTGYPGVVEGTGQDGGGTSGYTTPDSRREDTGSGDSGRGGDRPDSAEVYCVVHGPDFTRDPEPTDPRGATHSRIT